MQSVALFLEKFKTLQPSDQTLKRVIRDVVFDILNITFPEEAISVRGRVVYIAVSAGEKATLFMHKEAITTAVCAMINRADAPDMR